MAAHHFRSRPASQESEAAPPAISRKTFIAAAGLSLVAGVAAGAATVYGLPKGGSPSGSQARPGTAQGGAGGSANTQTFDYTGTYAGTLVAEGESISSSGETYDATEKDVVAALAQNAGTLSLSNVTLTKAGDDTNGDACNFYGVNSVLTTVGEGSSAVVDGGSLTATSKGSNGVFATDGSSVLVTGATIQTSADNSRGLDATYGGSIVAGKMTISTKGDHCAGIATDRGGGSISCVDSSIATAGSGSPILYSTGDVQVSGISGTATGSQIAGMEGLNTILIHDSELTSAVTGKTASDPVANGVIIYQSTSGDAETTTGEVATFQVSGSTLTSAIESGSFFYLTNTQAAIVVSDSTLSFDSDAAALLTATGNDSNNWGQSGSNGATVSLAARKQRLMGRIEVDTISSATVYLLDGSTWTGAGTITNNGAGATASSDSAPLTVNVDETSTWVITDDCTVSALYVASGGSVVDGTGAAVTIVADGKTVVTGAGSVTVTVASAYGTSVDAGSETELKGSSDMIDRSAYDEAFSTTSTWSM